MQLIGKLDLSYWTFCCGCLRHFLGFVGDNKVGLLFCSFSFAIVKFTGGKSVDFVTFWNNVFASFISLEN